MKRRVAKLPPLSLRLEGDPVLTQPAAPVAEYDETLRVLVRKMQAAQHAERGIGLAAPQVGVSLSLFTWTDESGNHAVTNPKIVEASGEWECREGCLSIPGRSWLITRPRHVTMVGVDPWGRDMVVEASDLSARLFQHELDHLNGVLISSLVDQCSG